MTIRYDPGSVECLRAVMWLKRQPALVRLDFPRGDAADDLSVVGDAGEVWRGPKAWIMCLYALEAHRGRSLLRPRYARALIVRLSAPSAICDWMLGIVVATITVLTIVLAVWFLSRFS